MLKDEVTQRDAKLRQLRAERSRAAKVAKLAAQARLADPGAAENAEQAVRDFDADISRTERELAALVTELGDLEAAGRPGGGLLPGGENGWRTAAAGLQGNETTRVDLPGSSLLRAQAPATSGATTSTTSGTATPISVRTPLDRAASRTILYPWALPQESFPAPGEVTGSDYRVTFSSDPISGIERDVDETSTKADLGASVALVTPVARMFAITASGIPQRVLANESSLAAFLEQEMRRKLDLEIDQHVVDVITASSPASGSTGTGLIEQVRRGVAAHRALGSSPSVLAVSPDDSADLDLSTTGADDAFVFVVRDSGSASPLWSLTVVESEAVDKPLILDPLRLGILLTGAGSILSDPYSGMERNLIRLRCEVECVASIRSATGAYVIG